MIHKLGQDFSNSVELNLLPGIELSRGYWRSDLQYISDINRTTIVHHSSYNHGGSSDDFKVIVGQDVHSIELSVYRHNSFPGYPNTYIKYSLRVDRLILLNIVYKLLGSKITV